jgi:hypothetical protein
MRPRFGVQDTLPPFRLKISLVGCPSRACPERSQGPGMKQVDVVEHLRMFGRGGLCGLRRLRIVATPKDECDEQA